MKNNRRISHMEICLCARCVEPFYESDDHYVKRIDPYQAVLEPCCICQSRYGYDYAIWDNSARTHVRKERGI